MWSESKRRWRRRTTPGYDGYSFADFATERGYPVVTIDPLGTGESSKPVRDFDFGDIAAALASAVRALPAATGERLPAVAVTHSLGGYLAITQPSPTITRPTTRPTGRARPEVPRG